MTARPAIVLVPLDERPVNTGLVADVAAVAGHRLELPPEGARASYREAASTDALAAWLRERAADPEVGALVVSVDMLVHGGLIPARTTHGDTATVLRRLDVLREIKNARPELPILAVTLVTRASDHDSSIEEPEYWATYGRRMHALGREAHQAWEDGTGSPDADVPADVRRDFARRRLRNHIVNLSSIDLRADGVLDHLVVTADDTARYSAGSVEQAWLAYWGMLDPEMQVPIYPGADETGAVLVGRALTMLSGITPRVRYVTADPEGMERIPPYENAPLSTSVPRQIAAAGASVVDDDADLVLVVHTSDPARGDQGGPGLPEDDDAAAAATVALVAEHVATGVMVAVADLRYANGSDPTLVEGLRAAGLLDEIVAYGGWNTAGNALGSTVALGVAAVVADRTGLPARELARPARVRRLLDDHAYQSVVRKRAWDAVFHGDYMPLPDAEVADAESWVTAELRREHEMLFPGDALHIEQVFLPWKRAFEVDILLA
ncbi:DUF4127 family protein [Sanguibacter sp. HDW7]|uniref:DUF4127 family protein n=1 Tax=Sanguibacter sp. HDW7 TaxID=2714931 RepID=UPI00140A5A6F|nr:DUF4127 family protein [Sanguibacter sp. HDW7]QIK84680.1 DUF4127 family protein [Sanguibacter sp. HDW7]